MNAPADDLGGNGMNGTLPALGTVSVHGRRVCHCEGHYSRCMNVAMGGSIDGALSIDVKRVD